MRCFFRSLRVPRSLRPATAGLLCGLVSIVFPQVRARARARARATVRARVRVRVRALTLAITPNPNPTPSRSRSPTPTQVLFFGYSTLDAILESGATAAAVSDGVVGRSPLP